MNGITPPPAQHVSYDKEMIKAISEGHHISNEACEVATKAIDHAIFKRRGVAEMVYKFSRSHKQDLKGALIPALSPDWVRRYMAIRSDAQHPKREKGYSKRQMEMADILPQQEGRGDAERQTASKPSFVSSITKLGIIFTKAVQDRPVSEWSANEKEQIRAICAPIAKVLREIGNE